MRASSLVVVLFVMRAPLEAQELPVRITDPATAPYECAPWTSSPPSEEGAPRQAREIASRATEATVLGDFERVRALLERALELDDSSSDLHYRHARVLEALGERQGAIEALCRVQATGGEGVDLTDAGTRLDSLAAIDRLQIPDSARAAFDAGVIAARGGRADAAVRSFRRAAEAAPDWPAARYNLGVTLDRSGEGEDAEEQLRHYLELDPQAVDALAVSHRIGQLQAARGAGPRSRGTALALGLAVPGLGQFYSGRTGVGLAVLASVGGVVAAGLLDQQVHVRCMRPPADGGGCPAEEVVSRDVERPRLNDALVAAGVITVLAAFEALLSIDGGQPGAPEGWSPARVTVSAGPSGASSLVLVRVPVP